MSVQAKGEGKVVGKPEGTPGDLLSRIKSASEEAGAIAAALRGMDVSADSGLARTLAEMIGKMADAISAASSVMSGRAFAFGTGDAARIIGRDSAVDSGQDVGAAAARQSEEASKRRGIQVSPVPASAGAAALLSPTSGKDAAAHSPAATPPERLASGGQVSVPGIRTAQAMPAPAAGSAETGMPQVFERMAELADLVVRDGMAIPDEHLAFARKASAVWKKFGSTDKAPQVLADLVGFLDGLDSAYGMLPGGEGFVQQAKELASEVAALLPEGTELFPKPGETPDEMLARRPDLAPHLSLREIPSRLPKRTLLYVLRRGFVSGGNVLRDAAVVVSSGEPHQARERLLAVAGKVLMGKGPREPRSEALAQILKLAGEYSGGSGGLPEDVALRLALNAVDAASEGGNLEDAAALLADRLKELGLREIRVPLGERFDERFGPSKYERRKVPSDRPVGTIVRVIQRGFLNSDGAVVQKAIVGVSAG